MKTLSLVILCGILVVHEAHGQAPGHVRGRLLAQVRQGARQADIAKALAGQRAVERGRIPGIDVAVLEVPDHALERIQEALSRTGLFTFVEPDGVAAGAVSPNDPSYTSQWHLSKIQASAAWDVTKGITSAPVAVIDSGIEPTHPDLMSKLLPGWNFLNGNSNTADVLGHGTATAGTVAAATDNAAGIAGVAWEMPIMPLVVLNSSDYASYSNIASAITYAVDRGARVINISIGGSSSSSTLQSAANYAWNKGALIFASAMNTGSSTPYYPAACTNVIAVAATTGSDTRAGFSNFGNWIDLSAPGESILTTSTGGGYSYWSGTSFASPVAAGVAGLILGVRPAMSNTAVLDILKTTADDLGSPGFDQDFGWGRVNAYKAVMSALSSSGSSDTVAPVVSISSPANNANVSGTIQIQGTAADKVGVARVELYVDNLLQATTYTSPFAFSWNTTSAANSVHTIVVKAYDTADNVGSSTLNVTVANASVLDTQAPMVTITNPANNSRVSGNVKVVVAASDNIGVSQISIYVDGTQVSQCAGASCTYTWNTRKVVSGSHTIVAKAWDSAGNAGVSAPVTVIR